MNRQITSFYQLNYFKNVAPETVQGGCAPVKTKRKTDELKINEIFYSLQGESTLTGLPTVFVRLTGCPLRCHYCDAEYAFHEGELCSFASLITTIQSYQTPYVCVTGGEPLAQRNCLAFLQNLADLGFTVSLETSGALDISKVDARIIKVMDLKTPASGEVERNKYSNLEFIHPQDQIKFVICDYQDYLWSRSMIAKYNLLQRCHVLLSASYAEVQEKDLATWILADRLNVRMQLQIHKYIWGDIAGV